MCRPCFKAVSLIYDALLTVRVTPLYPESFFAKIQRKRTSSSSKRREEFYVSMCVLYIIRIFSGDAKIFPRWIIFAKIPRSTRYLKKRRNFYKNVYHPDLMRCKNFALLDGIWLFKRSDFLLKKRNIEINEIEVYKYRNRKNYRRNLREITSNFNETAYINRLPETKKVYNIRKNDIIVFKLRLFIIRVKMKFN